MNLGDFNPSPQAIDRLVTASFGVARGIVSAQAQSEYSNAVTTINDALANFDQQIQQDPNWQEYDSKLAQLKADLWQKVASKVTIPAAMAKTRASFENAFEQHRVALDQTSNKMRINQGLSDLNNNLSTIMNSEVLTDKQKRDQITSVIKGAESTNLVSPLDAQKLIDDHNQAITIQEYEAKAFSLGRNGPQWILDPSNTPEIDDNTRKQLSGAVEGHINAVDKANNSHDEQIGNQVTNEILQGKVTDPGYFSRLNLIGPNARSLRENLYNFWKTSQSTSGDNRPSDPTVKNRLLDVIISNASEAQKLNAVRDAHEAGSVNYSDTKSLATMAMSYPVDAGVSGALRDAKSIITKASTGSSPPLDPAAAARAKVEVAQMATDPKATADSIIQAANNLVNTATDKKVGENLSSAQPSVVGTLFGWLPFGAGEKIKEARNAATQSGQEKIFENLQKGNYVGTLNDNRFTDFYQGLKLSVAQAAERNFPDQMGNMSVALSVATSIPIVTVKDKQGNPVTLTIRYDEQNRMDKWYRWNPIQASGDPVKDQLNAANWELYGMIK